MEKKKQNTVITYILIISVLGAIWMARTKAASLRFSSPDAPLFGK